MAGALPFMSAAGGVVSGYGALLKGQMTANSLNAQADLEENQSKEALQAGQYDVFRQQLAATSALGRANAAYGANGVSSTSGSAQAVLLAGAQNAELDRQNILHSADIKATNYKNQASLNRFGANAALQGSYFAALGSVLGGATSLASNYVGGGGGSGNASMPGPSSSISPNGYGILTGAGEKEGLSAEDPGIEYA